MKRIVLACLVLVFLGGCQNSKDKKYTVKGLHWTMHKGGFIYEESPTRELVMGTWRAEKYRISGDTFFVELPDGKSDTVLHGGITDSVK